MPESNSYTGVLTRVAEAMESVAAGAGKPLKGKFYDFTTDDAVREAVADIARSLGAEVNHA